MQNPKTAIQEIKKLMVQFGFMSDEPTMVSFKLEDNTIVETPELKVGNKITKVSDEFERVVLQDGKFRLVENFEIKVVDGIIKSVKQIFVDAKLVDGTQIKVEGDEVIEGAKVVVVTEEGEIPAPDGVHELESGMKVETKEGVIAKIEEKVEAGYDEKMMEEEVKEDKKEEDPIKEIVSLLKDMMEKVSQKMKDMEDKVEKMKDDFNSFKKEPAGKKISDGKTEFSKTINNDDAIKSKLDMIAELRKNNK